jgi:DNA-directed RNA polymerase subunit RPC12/RpoP
MQLSNCADCGKMFRHDGKDTRHCQDCERRHELLLRSVKDLILEKPGLTVQELSELSGVSYKQIMEWVNDGRILR